MCKNILSQFYHLKHIREKYFNILYIRKENIYETYSSIIKSICTALFCLEAEQT